MIYRFGEFELDEALLELRSRDAAQLVPPRVLRALLHLVRHRERAVSRDELVEVVWGGLAVSDAALSQTILLARKATRDDVIKTVRGHGFRFAAKVTEVEREAQAAALRPTQDAAEEPLLGRAPEQALLWSRLELAERGRGSLVLIQGEPGIGKTRLLEALGGRATRRGAHVFWGRSWENGGAPAFWPFMQVLRAMYERYGREAMRSWLDDRCRDLLYLIPELAPPGAGVSGAEDSQLEVPQAQFRVFDALARVLRRMAHALHRESAQPPLAAAALVIALDDLHAADDATIHCLRFLSADLRDAPLLVVGALRELEVYEPGTLASLLGGPLENTHRLRLQGLVLSDVARLLEGLLGHEPSAGTSAQLHELARGNPFLIGELARYAHGDFELSALRILHVPERLARAVRRRLEGLPDVSRALLELAAVLGVEFPIEHLRAAGARPIHQLLRELDPALRSGVLDPVAGSAGARLRFVHALVRDTLYAELSLERRLSLHKAVAESLEGSAAPAALPLYELAHHYFLAAPLGLAEKAADYALKAAAHAASVLAFDTAASLRDRAIGLCEAAREPVLRWQRLLDAGHAWFSAGELDKAFARYSSAAEHAREHRDAERFGIAALYCVRVRRGLTLLHPQLQALIGQALAMQAAGDSALKSLLIGFRGVSDGSLGDATERDAATRDAVDMARRVGDDSALATALIFRCWLMSGALASVQTRDVASEAATIARRTRNDEVLLEALYWRMHGQLLLGEVAQAERDLAEYTALAERVQHVLHRYWAQAFHAMRCAWSGDFAGAARLSDAALARGIRIQEPLAGDLHAAQRWNASSLTGTRVELPASLFALLSHEGPLAGRAFEINVAISIADVSRARSLYDALAGDGFTDIPQGPHRLWILALLSHSCACFDDRGRAARLYELLLPYAELNVFPMASWIYLGPVAEYLGQLANCLGDHALAAAHFEHAIDACTKLGARPQLARVRYQYGHTLRALPGASQALATELLEHVGRASETYGTARSFPLPLHAQL